MLPLLAVLVLGVFAQQSYADKPEAIVGGTRVVPGELPYQVSLRINGQHFCGGTIVSPTTIVTAGHCLYGMSRYTDITVVCGTLKINQGVHRKVKSGKIHPNYNPSRTMNDAAVLILDQPLQYNAYIKPLQLATEKPKAGTPCTVSGWGKMGANLPPSSDLLKANVKVVNDDTCKNIHGRDAITNAQLCTLEKRGVGACMGDSGGPLNCGNKLCGIVSWGNPCALGTPDVFTNVVEMLPFLGQYM